MYFDGPQLQGGMPPMDPNAYAQKYASENGISLDEAKEQLRAKFGDPQKPNSTFVPNDSVPMPQGPILQFSGEGANFPVNPLGIMTTDPAQLEAYVKNGAKQAGVTEREFAQMLGLPDKSQPKENDKTNKLKELGIPENIIEQGDDAIRKYAHDHDIDLPAKERR